MDLSIMSMDQTACKLGTLHILLFGLSHIHVTLMKIPVATLRARLHFYLSLMKNDIRTYFMVGS